MFSKKIKIELDKKDDIIHLEPISDIHIGHVGFDEDLYKKRIKAICRDKNRYTFFGGDALDAITTYDKRFNPDMSIEHDVDNQRQRWQDMTQPLIDIHTNQKNEKVWGFYHGNHDYKIVKSDFELSISNLSDNGFIVMDDSSLYFDFYH